MAEPSFWCPCGKCSLDSFLRKGCPQVCLSSLPSSDSFPYLDTSQLSEDERSDLEDKLLRDAEVIIEKFSSLVTKTLLSLKRQGISYRDLAICVVHLKGFVHDHEEEIEQAGCIENIFFILRKRHCWSFLNYNILEQIINEFGSDDVKKLLDWYHCDLKVYCKRSIFQVPKHICSKENTAHPTFTVKTPRNTLEGVIQAKRKIAETLGMRPSDLQICGVEEGCAKVDFLVPEYIAKTVLPPSSEQLAALAEESIQFLEYNGKPYSSKVC